MMVAMVDSANTLGSALRARRRAADLSLRAVASESGVSASFLSQAENNKARPRIETLHRIAAALDTTAQALLADAAGGPPSGKEPQRVSLTRAADDGTVQQSDDPADGIVRSLVAGSSSLHALEIVGAPAEFGDHYDHPGDELLYVIDGHVEVEVDGELYRLGPGDSITYGARLPHRTRRLDDNVHLMIVTAAADVTVPS
jgi:transcriptional regulator with XRE-family HTH domain